MGPSHTFLPSALKREAAFRLKVGLRTTATGSVLPARVTLPSRDVREFAQRSETPKAER